MRYIPWHLFLIAVIATGVLIPLYSQDSAQTMEELEIRYAGELNHIPVGCRTVGMGNTGVVLPYSNMSFPWNPSLISLSESYEVSVEGAKLYGGLSSLGMISFNAPVQNEVFAGIFYKAFFPDDIMEYDSLPDTFLDRQYTYNIDGYPIKGIFHNNQHSIIACVAKLFSIPIPRPSSHSLPLPVDIGIGLNVKSLIQTMTPGDKVRMGYNVNIDVGTVLRMGVDYDLAEESIRREVLIGIALRDIIPTKMIWLHSYEDYEEPIDYSQYYGVSYIDRSGFLFGNWTIALSLHRQYETTLHAGLEGEFFNMVAFRAGISNKIATLGAGVHYKRYSIDYSFTFDEIDYSFLRLAVGVKF